MGNSASSDKKVAKQFHFPFMNTYSSSFYLEQNLIYLLYSEKNSDTIQNLDVNRLIDLVSIIISRPDKIKDDEITLLLEKIIEKYNPNDQSKTNNQSEEQKFIQNSISKIDEFNEKFNLIASYRQKEFIKKVYLSPPKLPSFGQDFDFSKIINAITFILNDSLDQYSFNSINQISTTIKSVLPLKVTIAPDSIYFFPKEVDNHIFDFNDYSFSMKFLKSLGCRSLSTNGQFIFILSSMYLLYVFPIMNNGTLMPPKMVHLPYTDQMIQEEKDQFVTTNKSCIASYLDKIEILPYPGCDYIFSIQIDKIIRKDETFSLTQENTNKNEESMTCDMKLNFNDIERSNNLNKFICKVTNGIIYVVVHKITDKINQSKIGFTCEIFDLKTGKPIHSINLHENKQQQNNNCVFYPGWDCNESLPELFPDINYSEVPIETNGTTISFIFEEFSIYRTFSLISGEFLSDEKFSFTQSYHIISTTIDSLNNCRWILTSSKDNKVSLQKMKYTTSVDPHIFNIKAISYKDRRIDFPSVLSSLLKDFCLVNNPPSFLLCNNSIEFNETLKLLTTAINKDNIFMAQTLSLLVSLNLFNNQLFCFEFQGAIIELIQNKKFETSLKFLVFFSFFPSLFKIKDGQQNTPEDIARNNLLIGTLISLFVEASTKNNGIFKNRTMNDFYVNFALRIIENCDDFGLYPLLSLQNVSGLLENDLLLTVFIIHQRVLIRNATNFVEDENSFEKQDNKKNKTPLTILQDYWSDIDDHFLKELEKFYDKKVNSYDCEKMKDFVKNPFYQLFHNFIRLLIPLTKNHLVSQPAGLYLNRILKSYILIPFVNENLMIDLLETIYIYGMFLSTLISGGSLTPFEKDFIWVIQSNLNLLNNKEELNQLDVIQPINFSEDVFSLNFLYSVIKPSLNRKLSNEILLLDKAVLIAITQHLNCSYELFYLCNPNNNIDSKTTQITKPLRYSFLQMQRIRFQYKNVKDEYEREQFFNLLFSKCQLLCKLKSDTLSDNDPNLKSVEIANFILSSFTPKYIKGVFRLQMSRNSISQNGFPFLNQTFENDKNHHIKTIIGHVFKKFLTTFEGLNSILCLTQESILREEDINLFFKNIYPIDSNDEKTPNTRIIPYRFFKSIKSFPDILVTFLATLFNLFDHHSNDPGFYALIVSLIKFTNYLPLDKFQRLLPSLCELPINTYKLSLIENIIAKANDDFIYPDKLIERIFSDTLLTSPINIKIVMRIRYQLLSISMNEYYDNFLNIYFSFIGDHLFDISDHYSFLVTELITLFRKVYLQAIQFDSSPIRNSSFYHKLMNHSLDFKDKSDESFTLSLCTLCGFQMDAINPYSFVNVCSNKNEMNSYLVVQNEKDKNSNSYDLKTCNCYSFPFDISNDPIKYSSLPKSALITVIPEVIINDSTFSEKIKNLLMTSHCLSSGYEIFPICAQALLNLYVNNPTILNSGCQNLINFICSMATSFSDIYLTFSSIKNFKNNNSIKVLDELTPQFGVMNGYRTVTYLSLPLQNNLSEFELNLEVIDDDNIFESSEIDLFHFGVASDALEEEQIRLSTIGFPTGINFPEKKKVCDINFNNKIGSTYKFSFVVNVKEQKFSFNNNEIKFPIGRKFRFIIYKKEDTQLKFYPFISNQDKKQKIFNEDESPDLDKIISTKRKTFEYEDFNYLQLPDSINKTATFTLKEDYNQYEEIKSFTHEIDINEKVKLMAIQCPMNPVLHLKNSKAASKSIIDHHLKGLFLKLGRQWLTVLVMKIALNNSSLISKYAFDLFCLFSIPLEEFNQEEFNQNHFPFSLERPPWKSSMTIQVKMIDDDSLNNAIFDFLVASDMMNALSSMIKNNDCMNMIAEGLFIMSSSNNLHQIALPSKYHSFKCSNEAVLSQQSIVCFNNYEGLQKKAAFIIDEEEKIATDVPFIYKADSMSLMKELKLNKVNQISILEVNNSFKNDWIIDTPIELLVHLKNFAFAAKSEKHLSLVKTILLDLYLGKSPFALPYIDQFQNFAQIKCSSSLFYKDELYIKHLIALAGHLKSMKDPDADYVHLYESEQRLISSKFTIDDASHFPEFFPEKANLPTPSSDSILIPNEKIDPGSISSAFQSRIMMIKILFQERKSIVGLQFWEILPIWNKIIQIFGFDNSRINSNDLVGDEEIFPCQMTVIDDGRFKVNNPNKTDFTFKLTCNRQLRFSEKQELVFGVANDPDYESFRPIVIDDVEKPIKIVKGDTFFTLTLNPFVKVWETLFTVTIEPANKQNKTEGPNKAVKITKEYRKEFVDSMKSFAVDWKMKHTEKLLNVFDLRQLISPSFDSVSKIALESDLCKIFPRSVVLLRSLLLHQFNFIRLNKKSRDQVSDFLWNSCSSLIPIVEKSSELTKAIVRTGHRKEVRMSINRHIARSLINSYNEKTAELSSSQKSDELRNVGKRKDSIISQFSQSIKDVEKEKLQAMEPFNVAFSQEEGIDCGGPTRVLLNETTESIFEPSSQLFMKTNCNEEYFIPETRKRRDNDQTTIMDEYFSIGVLLGIISRLSYPQYVPFAPFIWKFIAGEPILPDDIAEVDSDLMKTFGLVRGKQIEPSWTATTWTSSTPVPLKRKTVKTVENDEDEVSAYLFEYTKFRLSLITPMLNQIRDGFFANTEIRANPLLCGKVLSFMAQGTGDISTEMIKAITNVNGSYNNEEFKRTIDFFWLAIDELTVEQKRSFLKFVAGVTRIPKVNTNQKPFHITIQPLDRPPTSLPVSMTCFNRLSIPLYQSKEVAKEKILFALENCNTMELQ